MATVAEVMELASQLGTLARTLSVRAANRIKTVYMYYSVCWFWVILENKRLIICASINNYISSLNGSLGSIVINSVQSICISQQSSTLCWLLQKLRAARALSHLVYIHILQLPMLHGILTMLYEIIESF